MHAIELQSGCGKRFQPHGGAQPSTAAGRQPIRAALFLRLWFGTVGFTLSLCLALAAGCQHRLPRTSSALPSPALGTPAVPQPSPVSRMSHSGLAPAAHSTRKWAASISGSKPKSRAVRAGAAVAVVATAAAVRVRR
ncbi:MAG: hypothetical protein ACK53L_33140, partial [Pirellulaceae bacterium]